MNMEVGGWGLKKGHNKSLSNTRQPAYAPQDGRTDVIHTEHGGDCRRSALRGTSINL